MSPRVSIIVPAHNEQVLLPEFLTQLVSICQNLRLSKEIIIVENGSTDHTLKIAQSFARRYRSVNVLSLSETGYGIALFKGLLAARGDYLVIFNVDFWDKRFLELTAKDLNGRDIILGSKLLSGSSDNRPWYRQLVTTLFNTFLKVFLGYPGTDTHGLKVIRRLSVIPVVHKCVTRTGIFDTELMVRAHQKKLKITEIPVQVSEVRPARFSIARYFAAPRDLWQLYRAVFPGRAEFVLLSLAFVVFVVIRSLHFVPSLNFSTDPALFSSNAHEIWRQKSLRLIGPTFSINYFGRYAFQGSVIYYFQLIFLLLGSWNPAISSYLFMLWCGVSLFFLYWGTKWLIGIKEARFMVVVYTLLPYYVNYTKFLWNPNFQLSLSPLLIFLMGLYSKFHKPGLLLAIGIATGIILQFHYQFALVVIGLIVFYSIKSTRNLWLMIAGFLLGISPLIIFEIRHNFYNLQTIWLFLSHRSEINNHPLTSFSDYYILSLSLFLLLLLSRFVTKLHLSLNRLVFILLVLDIMLYLPFPPGGFRMAPNWSYLDELKVHQIITAQNLNNFNVANLIYDPQAATQKYLLAVSGGPALGNDYLSNRYLYVLAKDEKYSSDPAYEIRALAPFSQIGSWEIDDYHRLYLAERNSP